MDRLTESVFLEPVIYCPRYGENMYLSTCETRRKIYGLDKACGVCLETYGGC